MVDTTSDIERGHIQYSIATGTVERPPHPELVNEAVHVSGVLPRNYNAKTRQLLMYVGVQFAERNDAIELDVRQLATQSELSEPTVRRKLRELHDLGVLDCEFVRSGTDQESIECMRGREWADLLDMSRIHRDVENRIGKFACDAQERLGDRAPKR
jgi:hypothetical protein